MTVTELAAYLEHCAATTTFETHAEKLRAAATALRAMEAAMFASMEMLQIGYTASYVSELLRAVLDKLNTGKYDTFR